MRNFLRSEPIRDKSGALIYKYQKAIFPLMLGCATFLVIAAAIEPPTKAADIAIWILLLGAASVMSIQAARYFLVLKNGAIQRFSPWPWQKPDVFHLNDVVFIDIEYRALHISLKMKNGAILRVPILLTGSFQLVSEVASNSNAKMSKKVKTIIDYYS
jgi:hypothetical protein